MIATEEMREDGGDGRGWGLWMRLWEGGGVLDGEFLLVGKGGSGGWGFDSSRRCQKSLDSNRIVLDHAAV